MGIKNFLLRTAGKKIAKNLSLTEGNMEDNKKWWKSKTVISGAVAVLLGTYALVKTNLAPGLPDVPEWLFTLLGAIGIYGRVTANTKIG